MVVNSFLDFPQTYLRTFVSLESNCKKTGLKSQSGFAAGHKKYIRISSFNQSDHGYFSIKIIKISSFCIGKIFNDRPVCKTNKGTLTV